MTSNETSYERATGYLSLATQLHLEYAERRSLEWKIHVALWTLLAASGYVLLSVKPDVQRSTIGALLAALVFAHLVWSIKMHRGETREHQLSIRYRRMAEALFEGSEQAKASTGSAREDRSTLPSWLDKLFKPYAWWLVAEVGTTVAIAVFLFAASGNSPASGAGQKGNGQSSYQRFVQTNADRDLAPWAGFFALDTKTGQLCRTVLGASGWREPFQVLNDIPTCSVLLAKFPD